MLKTTSMMALAAFIATTPVIAQTTTTVPAAAQSDGQSQTLPAAADAQPTGSDATSATEENQSVETEIKPKNVTQEPTSAEKTSQPVMGQIILQSESTILSNDLVGSSVYSPSDEVVGDINDMIINLDGTVEGVVIGVGGFLGIGEKNVAVKMSAISVTPMQDENVRLVLNSTREELETSPAFKSVAQQKVEEQLEQAQKAPGDTITGSVPSTEPPKSDSSTQ